MQYRFLLLDADNTLFDFSASEREALLGALSSFGVRVTAEMPEAYSAINEAHWKMLERGEITKSHLKTARFEVFCRRFSLDVDVSLLAKAYLDILSKTSILFPDAKEACRLLARDYRLFIITNGIKRVQEGRLARSPILPFIEKAFISEEVGFEKPDVRFFEAVAKSISDFDARRALVVGDSLSSDMRGGVAAGIDTCWYNPKGSTPPADLPITYTVQSWGEILSLLGVH